MDQLSHAELGKKKFVLFAEESFGLFTSKVAASLPAPTAWMRCSALDHGT